MPTPISTTTRVMSKPRFDISYIDRPCLLAIPVASEFGQCAHNALTSPVALNARARAFPKLSRAGAADRFGSGRLRGAAAAGGGQEALSYGVSFATTRSHQLARGSPACVLSPAFRAGSLDPLGRVGAEQSGATKNKAIADQSPLLKLGLPRSPIPKNVYASAIGLCKDSIIMQSRKPSNSDF